MLRRSADTDLAFKGLGLHLALQFMARRAIKNMPMLLLMIPKLVEENTLHFRESPSQPQPCIQATDNVVVSKGASSVDTGCPFVFHHFFQGRISDNGEVLYVTDVLGKVFTSLQELFSESTSIYWRTCSLSLSSPLPSPASPPPLPEFTLWLNFIELTKQSRTKKSQ